MNTPARLIIVIASLILVSCGSNNEKTAKADNAAAGKRPAMSAKERLAKNNNLEKRLTWERNGLKGKVKKVTIKEYKVDAGGNRQEISSWDDHAYNAAGYITESYTYDKAGKPEKKHVMMYDANNNDTASYVYDASGKLMRRTVIGNDSRGNEISSTSYDADGKKQNWVSIFKYDSLDNLIEMAFDNTGKDVFADKVQYTFDENGFKTTGRSFDSGKVKSTWTCKYDAQGNYLYGARYEADGHLISTDTCKYDKDGNLLDRAEYTANGGFMLRHVYEYDDHGNKTRHMKLDNGNAYSEKAMKEEGEHYEYTYDSTGNIIRKNTYKIEKGKKTAISSADYEYIYY